MAPPLGRNGQVFEAAKLRTMVREAERMGWATSEEDPRLTKVGRTLRKTALD